LEGELSKVYGFREFAKAHVRSTLNALTLRMVRLRAELSEAKIVVIFVVKDEYNRLPYFLRYYRGLGVNAFIAVDNGSIDNTLQYLMQQSDVSLFATQASYAGSRYGNDWVNYLLNKYCGGKWILYVDPDEFLQYPHIDRGDLRAFTHYLERKNIECLRCLMIDMYGSKTISETFIEVDQNPAEVCRKFDRSGYFERFEEKSQTTWVKGGVRGRIFFGDNIWDGPALNKIPLVRWKKGYAFLKSSHQLLPFRLNDEHRFSPHSLSGVLMHFKLISSMSQKVDIEGFRRQHTSEYDMYRVNDFNSIQLSSGNLSVDYTGWRSFTDENLICCFDWIDQG
jgi:glycosyltransferase involved in cell wall biosynthesis